MSNVSGGFSLYARAGCAKRVWRQIQKGTPASLNNRTYYEMGRLQTANTDTYIVSETFFFFGERSNAGGQNFLVIIFHTESEQFSTPKHQYT